VFAAYQFERFALDGSFSFMDSPPYFSGAIINGTLSPGTFWISIDDSSWPVDDPGTTEINERWDHIFSTYFTYDNTPNDEGWDGYFPPPGFGEPNPHWRFYTDAGDTLGGILSSLIVTIRDTNGDGVLSEAEYANKVISMNLVCFIHYSGGCYENLCGSGSASGQLDIVGAEEWEEELLIGSLTSASGLLILKDTGCSTGVESKTWGGIKAIHKD
jgi:hypothetical protein